LTVSTHDRTGKGIFLILGTPTLNAVQRLLAEAGYDMADLAEVAA
jgi:hypothetical protein